MKTSALFFGLVLLATLPSIASAFDNIQGILTYSVDFFNMLTRLAFSLGLLFFFWGLAKFILNTENETARAEGRKFMLWGVIALFLMASIWGIISLLRNDILGGTIWF